MVRGILIFPRAKKICDMQELCSFSAFASCKWNATCTSTSGHSLAVHYYSVTPISGKTGLIQWVDNLISMYSVFMYSNISSNMHSMLNLQQCEQYAQFTSTTSGTAAANTPIPPVPRPSDMFYGNIIPALKEKGLHKVISGQDWKQEVKRKALLELMKEAPSQLFYQ